MGYAVYITRARHHLDGSQAPIPQRDWRAVIENDPGLTADRKQPDLARWAGPSSVDSPLIDWSNGNLFTRDPDQSVIRKLIDVAGLLGGRVQGDDGELYSVERGRVVKGEPWISRSESSPSAGPPYQGVGEADFSGLDGAMAEEELEAALGALASHNARAFDAPADAPGTEDDPNASFARPPEAALEQDHRRAPPVAVPFRVGQRVRTSWGRPGTVVAIDPDADWGAGSIEIKYDDGRTARTSCVAHGLEPM